MRVLCPFVTLCHNVGQTHESKLYTVPVSDGVRSVCSRSQNSSREWKGLTGGAAVRPVGIEQDGDDDGPDEQPQGERHVAHEGEPISAYKAEGGNTQMLFHLRCDVPLTAPRLTDIYEISVDAFHI